ncbi:MAG TPA: hypothetical protein VJ952_07160 [Opitutales bacterium]|nr:hypothetical protein [Opitutales bacterium]
MKTTINLPDPLFRRAKATAAQRGTSMKALFTRAIEKDLDSPTMPVTELLRGLPRIDKETLETIRLRVEESDRDDLMFQEQAERQES